MKIIKSNSNYSNRRISKSRRVVASTGGKYKVIYNTADDYGWYGSQMPLSFTITANNDVDAVYRAWEELYDEDVDEEVKEMLDRYISQYRRGQDLDVEFSADANTIMFIVKGGRVVFSAFGNTDPNEIMQGAWNQWIEVHEEPEDEDGEGLYNNMVDTYPNGWTVQNFNVTRSNY